MKNNLKSRLHEGRPCFGVGLSIGHPEVAEILAAIGFDWAFIDTEHAPLELPAVEVLLQAMSPFNTVPVVRVAWNDLVLMKRVLDIGAYGLIVPWVNTREDAIRAVQAVKYPPLGLRGYGPRRAAWNDPDYAKTANDEVFLAVQIETQQAAENVDEILSVPGVDGLMIGPYDLSMSLGVFMEWANPKLVSTIDKICRSAIKHGVAPGIVTIGDDLRQRLEQGFTFIMTTGDTTLLKENAQRELSRVRTVSASLDKRKMG